ncbi:MAG: hypothetical protein R2729_06230 [Bryobacteraceae bacterium]
MESPDWKAVERRRFRIQRGPRGRVVVGAADGSRAIVTPSRMPRDGVSGGLSRAYALRATFVFARYSAGGPSRAGLRAGREIAIVLGRTGMTVREQNSVRRFPKR